MVSRKVLALSKAAGGAYKSASWMQFSLVNGGVFLQMKAASMVCAVSAANL